MKKEETGTVTMSLEAYNEMLKKLVMYDNALTASISRDGEYLEAEFNYNMVKPIVMQKMNDVKFKDTKVDLKKYAMCSEMSCYSTTVGILKDPEDEEE